MEKINQIEPSLGKEEKIELISVINSGWFSEAGKTKEFEKEFAKFVGTKYACAVTSGTSALYIGLKSLGVGIDDEVIVPDLTFVASPNSIEAVGAKPILVDIEEDSLNLDLTKVKKFLTKKTKAIMPVDFNGRSPNMKILHEIASKKNIFLIEDAAHAIGSYQNKMHMGTSSNLGVFSFSTPKIITTGQGGMIVTNDKKIYEKCMALKDFGRKIGIKKNMKTAFDHTTIGYNFKFTEFQAAVGLAQIRKLKNRISKKRKMFSLYRKLLNRKEIKFVKTNLKQNTPWMVDIILESKNKRNCLIEFLEKKHVGTRIFYPPIHTLKPYKTDSSEFKISSKISDRGLWLPSSITLTEIQIKHVCKLINQFFD